MFSDYNIISLGDHCAIPLQLNTLNIRKLSYPFDWISHKTNGYEYTILIDNFNLMKRMIETNDVDSILLDFIGTSISDSEYIHRNTIFPHEDNGTHEHVYSKYKRRFERLRENVLENKSIFFMLTRTFYVNQDEFDRIFEYIMYINSDNMIIFISGRDHTYLQDSKYKNVLFKKIEYKFTSTSDYNYDAEFRNNIRSYIEKLNESDPSNIST